LESIFITLFIIGMIAAILGIVGLFKPLVNLRMANRKWAGAWIIGGFVVMMAAAVNSPMSPPEPTEPRSQTTAPVRPKNSTFATAEDTYLALSQCEAEPNADCSQEAAAAQAAGAAWDRRVNEISAEVDSRANCIKRELGASYDTASQSEILAARRRCAIIDPDNAEELMRQQRERLTR
jgi:hypothetical protein